MPQGPFNLNLAKIVGSVAYTWLQLGKQQDLLTSDLHGRKYQQSYQGNLFSGANQAGATLSNGLATTYVGLCLSNPAASGKNLALRSVAGAIVVAPAAMIGLGLLGGYAVAGVVTHTTPITPVPAFINGAGTPVGKLDAACTIVGTPAWLRWLTSNTATTNNASFNADIEGSIIIPPGGYVAVGTLLAAGPTAGFIGSMEWEEISP